MKNNTTLYESLSTCTSDSKNTAYGIPILSKSLHGHDWGPNTWLRSKYMAEGNGHEDHIGETCGIGSGQTLPNEVLDSRACYWSLFKSLPNPVDINNQRLVLECPRGIGNNYSSLDICWLVWLQIWFVWHKSSMCVQVSGTPFKLSMPIKPTPALLDNSEDVWAMRAYSHWITDIHCWERQ